MEPFTARIKITVLLTLMVVISAGILLLYYVRPPGEPRHSKPEPFEPLLDAPYFVKEGKLPGVTWTDDIQPIFVRNGCGNCHTRGKEARVEGLQAFALGMIDPADPHNPFYSYHELVYAEGEPLIQEGETLRDGQCCWPRGLSQAQQRRIWVGHSERSAIMRKLDRDYYDWNRPPRFFEEGLMLSWGMPMPMFHMEEEEHSSGKDASYSSQGELGHENGPKEEHNEEANDKDIHDYNVRSFFGQIAFRLSLWLGGERDQLYELPSRIPARDRAILRYWIDHAIQLKNEGTGIEVRVVDKEGRPVKDSLVFFLGNYNSLGHPGIRDRIGVRTDNQGKAFLSFSSNGIVTAFWFLACQKDGLITEYKPVNIIEGKIARTTLRMP